MLKRQEKAAFRKRCSAKAAFFVPRRAVFQVVRAGHCAPPVPPRGARRLV